MTPIDPVLEAIDDELARLTRKDVEFGSKRWRAGIIAARAVAAERLAMIRQVVVADRETQRLRDEAARERDRAVWDELRRLAPDTVGSMRAGHVADLVDLIEAMGRDEEAVYRVGVDWRARVRFAVTMAQDDVDDAVRAARKIRPPGTPEGRDAVRARLVAAAAGFMLAARAAGP